MSFKDELSNAWRQFKSMWAKVTPVVRWRVIAGVLLVLLITNVVLT